MKTTPYFRNRTLKDRPKLQMQLTVITRLNSRQMAAHGDGFTFLKLTNMFAS